MQQIRSATATLGILIAMHCSDCPRSLIIMSRSITPNLQAPLPHVKMRLRPVRVVQMAKPLKCERTDPFLQGSAL